MWESDTETNSNDDQGLTENSVTEQEVYIYILKCKYMHSSTHTVPILYLPSQTYAGCLLAI